MSRLLSNWLEFGLQSAERLRWTLARGEVEQSVRHAPTLQLDGLERRLLMSATPLDVASIIASGDSSPAESFPTAQSDQGTTSTGTSTEDADGESQLQSDWLRNSQAESGRQIVFVDQSVSDLDTMLEDLRLNASNAEVFVLDRQADGIEQITRALQDRDDVSSIHIISHSDSESIRLGNISLGEDSIKAYTGQIATWGISLADDSDILFYGCNLSSTVAGRNLLSAIHALTGADIAASDDITGNKLLGGNWDFEYSIGNVESKSVFSQQFESDWQSKLSVITVTTTSDENDTGSVLFDIATLLSNKGSDGEISLAEAIIAANQTPGLDRIEFNLAGGGTQVINLSGALPSITDAIEIDGSTQPGFSDRPLVFIDGEDGLFHGLTLDIGSDGSLIHGLGIIDFELNGLQINSDGNVITGNWIGGFDPNTGDHQSSKNISLSAIYVTGQGNTIGRAGDSQRNVIGGIEMFGIVLNGANATDNELEGNWIGITPDGNSDAGLGRDGIALYFDTDRNTLSENVIGNARHGINLYDASENILIGNAIGSDLSETRDIPNSQKGIRIAGDSDDNQIGQSGKGNLIIGNGLDGIAIMDASTGNEIRFNQIVGNGELPIDLGGDGNNTNDLLDLDVGGNNLQNNPMLDNASVNAIGELTVDVELYSQSLQTYRMDFYEASSEAGSIGDPLRHIGFTMVNTDLTGAASITVGNIASGLGGGDRIVATATDPSGNTSEISSSEILSLVNSVPVLGSIESSTIGMFENHTATPVTSTITVVDIDFLPLQSATISIGGFQPTEDTLLFNDTANITGSWNSATGVLTLSGYASITEYEAALRSVEYLNSSENPTTTPRLIQFEVSDGAVSSGSVTRTIQMFRQDDPTTGSPVLPSTVLEDQLVTVDTSSINDLDGVGPFSYQWYSDGIAITGAESDSFTPGESFIGKSLSVTVSFSDGMGNSISLNSSVTNPVVMIDHPADGVPFIVGTAAEDETLSVSLAGVTDPDGLSSPNLQVQWFRDGSPIAGANQPNLTLGDADVNATLFARVTFSDDRGYSTTVDTALVGPIANQNDPPQGLPLIVGTLIEEQRLTADLSGISDDDGLPPSAQFQWLRDGQEIAGANQLEYTLTIDDVGHQISFRVIYTDQQGTVETIISKPTDRIDNLNDPPTLEDRTRKIEFGETLKVKKRMFERASDDPDGDTLEAVLVRGPESGTLSLQSDGSFVYTPAPDFFGTVTFQWQADDGELLSNVATVEIVIAQPAISPGDSNGSNGGSDDNGNSSGQDDSSNDSEGGSGGSESNKGNLNAPGQSSDASLGDQDESSQSVNLVFDDDELSRLVNFLPDTADITFQLTGNVELNSRLQELGVLAPSASIEIQGNLNRGTEPIQNITQWSDYALMGSTGQMWEQLNNTQSRLETLFDDEQLIVGSISAATGGFTVAALAWLRSGFLVLGFWQHRPLWSRMDPLVLMQGLRAKDDESLEEVIADQRRKLDQADGRDESK